jgi:D-serine deaminase-like pyridoxal phosphate-dependent protein
VTSLDTPVAVVDLERVDRNLERWQAHCDAVGLVNRPHVKTHRSIEIARLQVALGAAGITCQKLGEAEVMADAGLTDILVPYNIVGDEKLERLGALARRAAVTVSVDNESLLDGLARAARGAGELGVLVDCDTGLRRTGVATPERAALMAGAVARREGLRFAGFLTYPSPDGALAFLRAAVALAESAGLAVDVVSAGGTPAMWSSGELRPTVTEYRVGTYAFHDRATVAAGAATVDDVALTVHATVVSRPAADRAVLDAGSKTLSSDPGTAPGHGTILEAPRSTVERLSEEHAVVALDPAETLELGQRVRIVPNHACVVVNLADELVALRDGEQPRPLPVDARGRSR